MMHHVANRQLILGTGLIIEKGKKVPSSVNDYLKARYEKLGLMKKVYDSVEEQDNDLPIVNEKILEATLIEDYRNKEGGIKKLASKHGLTEYNATKILKQAGLV